MVKKFWAAQGEAVVCVNLKVYVGMIGVNYEIPRFTQKNYNVMLNVKILFWFIFQIY